MSKTLAAHETPEPMWARRIVARLQRDGWSYMNGYRADPNDERPSVVWLFRKTGQWDQCGPCVPTVKIDIDEGLQEVSARIKDSADIHLKRYLSLKPGKRQDEGFRRLAEFVAWYDSLPRTIPEPKPEPCPHYVDQQGLCHKCGVLLDSDAWFEYSGERIEVKPELQGWY